jgi:hypothetical protein
MGQTEKIKCLCLYSLIFSMLDGKSPKLHHFSLGWLHLKPELPQPFSEFFMEPFRICLILKADNEIIGITD